MLVEGVGKIVALRVRIKGFGEMAPVDGLCVATTTSLIYNMYVLDRKPSNIQDPNVNSRILVPSKGGFFFWTTQWVMHHSRALNSSSLKQIANRTMEGQPYQTARNTQRWSSELNSNVFGMGAWADEHPKPPYKIHMEDQSLLYEEISSLHPGVGEGGAKDEKD